MEGTDPLDELVLTYDVEKLWAGGSYGNSAIFLRTDPTSNLDGVWSAADDQWYCGHLRFDYITRGERLTPLVTQFYPSYQETILGTEGIILTKRIFVPFRTAYERSVCWLTEVQAEGPRLLEIHVDIALPAQHSSSHVRQPETWQQEKRFDVRLERGLLIATTQPTYYTRTRQTLGRAHEVRVFGSSGPPTHWEIIEPGRVKLIYHVLVEGYVEHPFIFTFSDLGEDMAWTGFLALTDTETVFKETVRRFHQVLAQAQVHTPDDAINRLCRWAGANMLRVQHRYRLGEAVTNNPPGDIVVTRDAAWYSFGASYLTPDFTTRLLSLIARHATYENGKLAEYIHAHTGEREDYGLNINDGTPLFIIAVHHHFNLTHDRAFLREVYPAISRAARYIISQIGNEGLVWSTGSGTNVYGIASWRNIIPGYTLNGAVTELNALCAWGLRCAADLAQRMGEREEAAYFAHRAGALRDAINTRLMDRTTGTYALNVDLQGVRHTDITGDLVFPLLADVAPPDVRQHLLSLFDSDAFWGSWGVHTVARTEKSFDPNLGHGLLGGVWPNLTAWVAFAERCERPERMVDAFHIMARIIESEATAERGHVVPGEFPEWFDGRTGHSAGMALSPWSPPTYLWLALEGLAGLTPTPEGLMVQPNLPPSWRWLAVLNVPYRGRSLTCCALDGVLYANMPVRTDWPLKVYEAIRLVPADCLALRLRRGDEDRLFVASPKPIETVVRVAGRRIGIRLEAGEAQLLSLGK